MPVIDMINHHERGAMWQLGEDGLTVCVAKPTMDNQCFVSYVRRGDPLDLALAHGFLAEASTVVRSAPITVEVDGILSIDVAGERLDVLNVLDPPRVRIEQGRLRLSHVTFDVERPDRLFDILQLAVSAYVRRQSPEIKNTRAVTRDVLEALMDGNISRLEQARDALDDTTESDALLTVRRAVAEQLRLIRIVRRQLDA